MVNIRGLGSIITIVLLIFFPCTNTQINKSNNNLWSLHSLENQKALSLDPNYHIESGFDEVFNLLSSFVEYPDTVILEINLTNFKTQTKNYFFTFGIPNNLGVTNSNLKNITISDTKTNFESNPFVLSPDEKYFQSISITTPFGLSEGIKLVTYDITCEIIEIVESNNVSVYSKDVYFLLHRATSVLSRDLSNNDSNNQFYYHDNIGYGIQDPIISINKPSKFSIDLPNDASHTVQYTTILIDETGGLLQFYFLNGTELKQSDYYNYKNSLLLFDTNLTSGNMISETIEIDTNQITTPYAQYGIKIVLLKNGFEVLKTDLFVDVLQIITSKLKIIEPVLTKLSETNAKLEFQVTDESGRSVTDKCIGLVVDETNNIYNPEIQGDHFETTLVLTKAVIQTGSIVLAMMGFSVESGVLALMAVALELISYSAAIDNSFLSESESFWDASNSRFVMQVSPFYIPIQVDGFTSEELQEVIIYGKFKYYIEPKSSSSSDILTDVIQVATYSGNQVFRVKIHGSGYLTNDEIYIGKNGDDNLDEENLDEEDFYILGEKDEYSSYTPDISFPEGSNAIYIYAWFRGERFGYLETVVFNQYDSDYASIEFLSILLGLLIVTVIIKRKRPGNK